MERGIPSHPFFRSLREIFWALPLVLALTYLGTGVIPALVALLFAAGILFPAAALLASFAIGRSVPSGLRILLGMVLVVILATPCYYLRRSLHVAPVIADTAAMVVLSLAAFRTGAASQFFSGLRGTSVRVNSSILFFWLPLVYCLIWTGFAAPNGNQILFCGLFPLDFCSLAGMVSLINASPGLPLNAIAGTGPLCYHWHYFAMPAWLTDFMGFSQAVGSALIICNYAVGCLLFLALWETAIRFCRGPHSARYATLTAVIVTFAPLITHFVLRIFQGNPFLSGGRNNLVLSVVNSMTAFGNNSLALAMVLMILLLVRHWRQTGKTRHLIISGLLLAAIPGYSATLIIPLAAVCGLVLSILMNRHFLAVFLAYLLIGTACFLTLNQLHGFSGSRGLPDFAFDGGRFLCTLILCGLPLWAVASWSLTDVRQTWPYALLIAACVVAPSILYVKNSPTGGTDLSMKTGSLILVVSTPMIALGLRRIVENWRRHRCLAGICAALLAVGFCQTVVFVLQFPLSHLGGAWQHSARTLPVDYCKAMDFLRVSTPRNAVVIASETLSESFPATPILFLAERRGFLPQTGDLVTIAKPFPLVTKRYTDFQRWEAGRFSDPTISKQFALNADILVLKTEAIPPCDWEERTRIGAYTIYKSRLHPANGNQVGE